MLIYGFAIIVLFIIYHKIFVLKYVNHMKLIWWQKTYHSHIAVENFFIIQVQP